MSAVLDAFYHYHTSPQASAYLWLSTILLCYLLDCSYLTSLLILSYLTDPLLSDRSPSIWQMASIWQMLVSHKSSFSPWIEQYVSSQFYQYDDDIPLLKTLNYLICIWVSHWEIILKAFFNQYLWKQVNQMEKKSLQKNIWTKFDYHGENNFFCQWVFFFQGYFSFIDLEDLGVKISGLFTYLDQFLIF